MRSFGFSGAKCARNVFALTTILIAAAAGNNAFAICNEISPGANPANSTITFSVWDAADNFIGSPCNNGTYINNGTVIFPTISSGLQNNGLYINNGLTAAGHPIHNYGDLINSSTGTINGYSALSSTAVENYSRMTNAGNIIGFIYNAPTGTILNSGSMGNGDGGYINEGTFINLKGGVLTDNDYYTIGNKGLMLNAGTIATVGGVVNSGTFLNTGTIDVQDYISIGNTGTFINNGVITSHQQPYAPQTFSQNEAGALLMGNGTIDGRVRIGGGVLSAGDGIGKMSVGSLSFENGLLLTEIGKHSSDFLTIDGSANFLKGIFEFSFIGDVDIEHGGRWGFLYAAEGITGWENLDLFVTGLDDHYRFFIDQSGNELYLNVASVPEPESYAMLLAGVGLLGGFIRRRRNGHLG